MKPSRVILCVITLYILLCSIVMFTYFSNLNRGELGDIIGSPRASYLRTFPLLWVAITVSNGICLFALGNLYSNARRREASKNNSD
ncbi:MAG: hypothetical protein FWG88_10495 [Oscillospiraceae bacterium]|nr:hypothetical protein [Oscillospiraceae bacterium]